jgi:hypothetical protein
MDEESRDFRQGAALEWPRVSAVKAAKDKLRNPKGYTRVLDKPDDYMFYEFTTRFADRTVVQVDVKYSENQDELIPIGIAMGGEVSVPIDDNIILAEKVKNTITGESRDRLFMPLVRQLGAGGDWSTYMAWAASPRNWNPQVVALNYSEKVHEAGAMLTLSSQLGGSSFVLQTGYAAQIVRKSGRTLVVCRFVPVCAEGLLSQSWYFGLREAIYFLSVVKESLKETAPASFPKAHKDIIRYPEPIFDLLAII